MRTGHLLASTALTTSAVFASGAAFAQPVTYNWTGWYVGFNVGGSSTDADHNVVVPGFFNFSSSGRDASFTGGAQIGYNWLVAPSWLAGFEGDINYLSSKRTSSFSALDFQGGGGATGEDIVGTQRSRLRWLSTVRARFGHIWDRSFMYATGGLAIGGASSSVSALLTQTGGGGDMTQFAGSKSGTLVGWAAGAGFEQAFTNRFSLKLEYLHFDLGDLQYNVIGTVITTSGNGIVPLNWPAKASFSGDIVRVGLNYKLSP